VGARESYCDGTLDTETYVDPSTNPYTSH